MYDDWNCTDEINTIRYNRISNGHIARDDGKTHFAVQLIYSLYVSGKYIRMAKTAILINNSNQYMCLARTDVRIFG